MEIFILEKLIITTKERILGWHLLVYEQNVCHSSWWTMRGAQGNRTRDSRLIQHDLFTQPLKNLPLQIPLIIFMSNNVSRLSGPWCCFRFFLWHRSHMNEMSWVRFFLTPILVSSEWRNRALALMLRGVPTELLNTVRKLLFLAYSMQYKLCSLQAAQLSIFYWKPLSHLL